MSDIIGPPDATQSPRYGGFPTFARLPRRDQVKNYDVAVVGVPFDSGVSYRPGARFGPAHIRQSPTPSSLQPRTRQNAFCGATGCGCRRYRL
jgi:arginase family enzyme